MSELACAGMKQDATTSTKLAALEYHRRGFHITLCAGKDGKAPLGKGWDEGVNYGMGEAWQEYAWTPDEIERAYRLRETLNVGIKFGPRSCIDIEADSEEQVQAFQELFEGCDIPRTPTFQSSRGPHRLFAYNPILEVPGKAVLKYKELGIRVGAGKGAHSIVPPSPGREWITSLDDAPLAELPPLVIKRILEANRPEAPAAPIRRVEVCNRLLPTSDNDKVEQARRYLAKVPGAVEGQGGDDHTFHVACVLVVGFDLSPDEAWPLFLEWNATCSPPWPEAKLRRKLDEADKQPGDRGGKLRDRQSNGSHGSSANLRNYTADPEGAFLQAAAEGDGPEFNGHAHATTATTPKVELPPDDRFEIRTITSRDLDSGDYTTAMLVDDVLAEGQPLVIAAPLKTLKTTIAVALAVALALGRAFLGKFWVREAVNVLILSGESGLSALQSAGRRIAQSYGYSLGDVGRLHWSTDLPRLGSPDHLEAIRDALTRDEISVLIVDPLYFMLPGQDAGNLMIVGAYLRTLSALCEQTGVTLIVVHHVKKTGRENPHEPPELSHISWAGTAEWARQWILLGRREPYVPGSGEHKLWLVTGGSAGHSGLHALDVFEGVGNDRTWQVELLSADDVRDRTEDKREQAQEAKRQVQLERDQRSIVRAMLKLADNQGTKKEIRERAGMSGARLDPALASLIDAGDVLPIEITKGNNRSYDGYKLGEVEP